MSRVNVTSGAAAAAAGSNPARASTVAADLRVAFMDHSIVKPARGIVHPTAGTIGRTSDQRPDGYNRGYQAQLLARRDRVAAHARGALRVPGVLLLDAPGRLGGGHRLR